MVDHRLVPRRLLPDSQFNWVYVVDLVIALIVTIFFLFYFNRGFGSLVAYAVRKYTWHKYRVYVDVQALQFSPLAGRLFFRGFRYHGHNETVLINDGYITWRYWLRRVRDAEYLQSSSGQKSSKDGANTTPESGEDVARRSANDLPCRIKAKVRGLEWFIYNRSPAYDSIFESISKENSDDVADDTNESSVRRRARLKKAHPTAEEKDPDLRCSPIDSSWSSEKNHNISEKPQATQEYEPTASRTSSRPCSSYAGADPIDSLPVMLQILPIKLECSKGAMVMGNSHTHSIMTAKFDSAVGRIDAQKPLSSLDRYKQLIDLDFTHPVIQFKPNRAFTDNQIAESAKGDHETNVAKTTLPADQQESLTHRGGTIWSSLRDVLPRFGRSNTSLPYNRVRKPRSPGNNTGIPGEHRWLGLTRYMDDEDELVEQERWKAIEYGRFETIVDSPGIAISIHWDVPGQVPKGPVVTGNPQLAADINGSSSPDWGIDLRIRGGEIHYGPWADRQRTDLQNTFFPTLYKDAISAAMLSPGDTRISTVFKIMIEVEVATKLVLHTREESKDWKWKGHATGETDASADMGIKKYRSRKKDKRTKLSPEVRQCGWLDLHVLPDSTVNFAMNLVAGPAGYCNRVELDLRGPEMTSSVNHDILWRSQSQVISCDLSNPREWNSLRKWCIDIQSNALEVFLLRDHVFLLTDLINDWSSSPAGDFFTFVPFKYLVNLQVTDFKLYINVNDSNIINNPSDVDDNTFVVVWGDHLDTSVVIPLEHYQPSRNAITFQVDARDGGFELRTPQWNTQHSFLKDRAVATMKKLNIHGTYDYATSTSPALTDTLVLKVHGNSAKINLHGFLIRYFMKIKDNYFGEDLHFRTMEEYKAQVVGNGGQGTEIASSNQPSKISNDLDVILNVAADHSTAVLPAGLYTSAHGINLDIASIRGDLRFTNYYMDLAVAFSPILLSHRQPPTLQNLPADVSPATEVFIDGLNLYGHRLFGLPPVEPTYVCNWDFDVGTIYGECTPQFVRGLLQGIRSFGFSFDDAENALPALNPPIVYDVTFLRVRTQPIRVWLCTELAAFRLSMQSLSFRYNDWAGIRFSEKLNVQIPHLTITVVDDQGGSFNRRTSTSHKCTQAYLQTDVDVTMLTKKKMSGNLRSLQQGHIKLQDVRTNRTPWLLRVIDERNPRAPIPHQGKIKAPAMQFPLMPDPVPYGRGLSSRSYSTSSVLTRSGASTRSTSSKSSFLTDKVLRASKPASIAHGTAPDTKERLRETSRKPSTPPHLLHSPASRGQRGSVQRGSAFGSPSPYRKPHFRLQDLVVDLTDVPILSISNAWPQQQMPAGEDFVDTQPVDQYSAKSSIFVNLNAGFFAFCTPLALSHTMHLLAELELDTAETMFDALQVDTMKSVDATASTQEHTVEITEVSVRVPSLQTRFLSTPTYHSPSASRCSGLSIDLRNLNLVTRISHGAAIDQLEASTNPSSLRVSLDHTCVALLAKQGSDPNIQPLITCTLVDTVVRAVVSENITGGLTIKNADVIATNEGLSPAIPSALQMISSIRRLAHDQSQMAKMQKSRLQLLVLSVILAGEEIPDPPFLTRASYVLRSANNHLRISDSWKLMARLRHILVTLPAEKRGEITEKCTKSHETCPQSAEDRVVTSLERCRGWDVAQVKHSLLMQKVYGNPWRISDDKAETQTPLKTSIEVGQFELGLAVGHSRNSIEIENLELAVLHNHPAKAAGGFIDPETFSVGDSIFQAHCAKFTANATWDLCGLIDIVLEIPFDQLPATTQDEIARPQSQMKDHKYHLVASSRTSIVNFVSINLTSSMLCQGMKASALVSKSKSQQAANLLVSAQAVTSELQSHSRVLAVSKLRQPSIFCFTDSHVQPAKEDQAWKVTGSCNAMSLRILEDPLLIVEVVDIFLKDEVTSALNIARRIDSNFVRKDEDAAVLGKPTTRKAHVTLCIDSYLLSLIILPSLIYRISGGVARTTIQHGLHHNAETLIDFDFQDHTHSLRTQSKELNGTVAVLDIPPINGRLSLDLSPRQRVIVFHTMIEEITLDASALHAILATISRSEITNLSRSIDREIQLLQSHAQLLFNAAARDHTAPTLGTVILYDAYIIAAGLNIKASSPLSSTTAREGQLDFKSGCLQAKGTNRDLSNGPALQFPEVEIRLDSIHASLKRVEKARLIPSGEVVLVALLRCTSSVSESGETIRSFQVRSRNLEVNMYSETAPVIIDIIGHLQDTFRSIDLTAELRTLRSMRRPRLRSEVGTSVSEQNKSTGRNEFTSTGFFGAMYSLEMTNLRLSWIIGASTPTSPGREAEDLVVSFSKIDLSTKRDNAARLLIENFQLQMVPVSKAGMGRSRNSALLPEVVFNVAYLSTGQDRRLAFQAAGKSLDLRLTSQFILPASDLRRSIAFAMQEVRTATADWKAAATKKGKQTKQLLGGKKFASVLVDADFAGAVVYIEGRNIGDNHNARLDMLDSGRMPQHGRYNQFTPDNTSSSATLRSPGLAFKIEYRNGGVGQESLNAEIKVDASSNILHPSVVPLIMEISSSVKEMVGETASSVQSPVPEPAPSKSVEDSRLRSADPSAIFGKTRVNFGLRICKQEFSLSCQPYAKVAATARFEDTYVTINTVQSGDHGQFFTVSAVFTKPQASVQHAYSREATGNLTVDSIFVSLMSSKHVSTANGLSVILKLSPLKVQINARQLQDVLLFRDIWVPQEIRQSPTAPASSPSTEPQAFIVQRYQQVAAAGAFPWNATVFIAQIDIQLDLGQSLGRSAFNITTLWISLKKTSDWEQNLCLGFDKVGVDATGRMSGLVDMQDFRVRTSIQWPMEDMRYQTPLIQASLAIGLVRVKGAFDYQAFVIVNIETLDFIMYNVRDPRQAAKDQLVAVVEGEKAQVFCTAISASQGLALYQAVQRLVEEKRTAYETSLREIEGFLRRKSTANPIVSHATASQTPVSDRGESIKVPIRLQTNVAVNLRAVNFGIFPGTFFDNQMFKLEAIDASARFSVALKQGKIYSALGMTLGQLRVALSGVARPSTPRKIGEVSIDEVVASAAASRGGLILGVPKTLVSMQTWQIPDSNHIDYIFRSSFEGNIDVGWNYSRISFIRGMQESHVRALAQRLGKPLPQSAVQITGGLKHGGNQDADKPTEGEQEKITAVVNVPQSKYDYTALQPPLVDTPQLRNLGEATPPLEWIGLHRERLPNLTHQIVIVSLLEVAKEVEDSYTKILGAS